MILVRNESFKHYLTYYPVTSCIVLLNTLVFLCTTLLGGITNEEFLYKLGGISFAFIQQKKEYYRFISYAFIHNGFIHITMNMLIILIFSPPIEKSLGKLKYTILFFLTIIGSGIAIVMLSRKTDVGASEFVYSLFGIYLSIFVLRKDMIDKYSRFAILFFIFINWVFTFISKNISIAGHFGGFIIGIIMGVYFIWTNGLKPFDHKMPTSF